MPPQARRAGKAKPDPQGPAIEIDFDGQTYVVRKADMTGQDARALRQEVGMSFLGLVQAIRSDPDIDLIAAFIWLARRLKGEPVAYDDVLDSINYDSDVDVRSGAKPAEVDDSPEA